MALARFRYFFLTAALSIISNIGSGQLCTGSLGDPIVNIDFGTGSNPGPPITTTSTNYRYTSVSCPPDGSYTVVNSFTGCFGNSWHNLVEDHTPADVNGYMMLVNASITPGDFYVDTVKNLCGSVSYEFSSWVVNVLKSASCNSNGTRPNITFSIETTTGTVIQTYNTGPISASNNFEWRQYGFFFTLPVSVNSLVLRITNNAPGGCGNDLALDDIAFRPCGPKLDAVFANVNGNNGRVNFCFTDNKSITLSSALQGGYNNPAFRWQESIDSGKTWMDINGAFASSYSKLFNKAGTYFYRMAAAEAGSINVLKCRVFSNVLTIIIDSFPKPEASNSSPVCVGASLSLQAKNAATYLWTGPLNFSSSDQAPKISPIGINAGGRYYVQVISAGGCIGKDSTNAIVSPLPVADAGMDEIICEGNKLLLEATGGDMFSWRPAAGLSNASIRNPTASPITTTTYTVTVTNPGGCKNEDSATITVYKKPVANAGPDKKIMEGQTIQLDGNTDTTAGVNFVWSPPQFINNALALKPSVNPPADKVYKLTVNSTNGCGIATDEVFVRVFKKITIPNAFTPNGDGINDVWQINGLETYPESVTQVYNRYGQRVFIQNGYRQPWDGRLNQKSLPLGTYYYLIFLNIDLPVLSGSITIIR
jgi:gliding motility-associated-like protein